MLLSFEAPLAGWIKVEIKTDNYFFSDSFTYTPENFILELIGVLNLLCHSDGSFLINGYSEPVIYDFIFEKKESELCFRISYKDRGNYIDVLEHKESTDKLILIFIKALTEMKSKVTNEEYKKNWNHEFPDDKFQKLISVFKQKISS